MTKLITEVEKINSNLENIISALSAGQDPGLDPIITTLTGLITEVENINSNLENIIGALSPEQNPGLALIITALLSFKTSDPQDPEDPDRLILETVFHKATTETQHLDELLSAKLLMILEEFRNDATVL